MLIRPLKQSDSTAVRKLDECRAWNPQQGTMFYWNPARPHTQFCTGRS